MLPWRRLDLGAGAIVTLPGQAGRWRVIERAYEAGGLSFTAGRLAGTLPAAISASAGSGVSQPDLPQGPTTLALLDLPSFGDDLATVPTLLIAATGASAGWRKATLMASLDDGTSWNAIGQTAAPAIIGQAVTRLGIGSAMIRDGVNSVDVELINDGDALVGSDTTALLGTANLALIGDELIQFATAEQIGPRLFRLGGLLRGRRGSEWAIDQHAEGDRFVLIDADTLVPYALPFAAIGSVVRVSAIGVGDTAPVEQSILFQARALRPPRPVAVSAEISPDGSAQIAWVRRSRMGWNWIDGIDAPLAEEGELYRLTASRAGGASRAITSSAPSATLDSTTLAQITGTGPLSLLIEQIGTSAASLPGTAATFSIGD